MWTGSGACGHDSQSWSRAALDTASRRNTDAQAQPYTLPTGASREIGTKGKRGPKVEARAEKTPQWSAVRRGRPRKWSRPVAVLDRHGLYPPRPTALRSLLWE